MLLNRIASWPRNILLDSNILWLGNIHKVFPQTLLWSLVICDIQVIVSIFSRIRRLVVVLNHTRDVDLSICFVAYAESKTISFG